MMNDLTESFVELVRRAATDLPVDVEEALVAAKEREKAQSAAEGALEMILRNVALAREQSTPVCQDTGTPIFEVYHPLGVSMRQIAHFARSACAIATQRSYLRPNAVDSLTGKNSGDNTGIDFPTLHFHEWDSDEIKVQLLLKGGGSENVGVQYKLPHAGLKAGRDLEGVRKVVLDAVYQAQGKGCAPGILGVTIGGDRGSGYLKAKGTLLRKLDEPNPDPTLDAFENRLVEDINQLNIGPMGFGGRTTVLGVKVAVQHRLPACYFVSVAYMCWAARRATMIVRDGQVSFE
jgi:fumarate hydratase class I